MTTRYADGCRPLRLRISTLWLLLLATPAMLSAQSVIQVNSTADALADDGQCTLREAVIAANTDLPSGGTAGECPAGDGDDRIAVPAGTYALTIAGADEDAGETGDLDAIGTLIIEGVGARQTIIDGNGIDRVLDVRPDGHQVTLEHLTVRGGRAPNGQSDPAGGDSGQDGGGLRLGSASTLTLASVVVTDNRAGDGGDGNDFPGSGGRGGGVFADQGILIVVDSVVKGNAAGDGGDSPDFGGRGGQGGGIAVVGIFGPAGLGLIRSTVTENATGDGGLSPDTDGDGGDGGGVWLQTAMADIVETTISVNQTGTTRGQSSGGGQGGGLYQAEGELDVVNSTLSGNQTGAGGDGGGVYVTDFPDPALFSLDSSTIAANVATDGDGGGIYSGADGASEVTYRNTIVAGNQAAGPDDCAFPFGMLTSNGHNLVGASTGCPTDDDVTVDPMTVFTVVLEELADNGGSTATHDLQPDSPARDAGSCAGLTTDQRGFPRPAGPDCDIGAVEAQTSESLFADGFESGNTSAWTNTTG